MSIAKFKTPKPNKIVLALTHPLNDVLFLKGLPLINKIPFIKNIPFIGRGVCRIRDIKYTPTSSQVLLTTNINFVGPNHPEFFTDWMLDKHLVGKKDLCMASWAAHSVVNGMGPHMQKFWLANNLIAQIPGSGNTEGKEYALSQALAGNTVLMHPEGMVHWTGKAISPVYKGIAELALQALAKSSHQDVYIHLPAWTFRVVNESSQSLLNKLYREIEDIGIYFGHYWLRIMHKDPIAQLEHDQANLGIALKTLHNYVIMQEVAKFKIPVVHHREVPAMQYNQQPLHADVYIELKTGISYAQFEYQVIKALVNKALLESKSELLAPHISKEEAISKFKEFKKQVNDENSEYDADIKKLVHKIDKLLSNILKFNVNFYQNEHLSAEEVAECLQRIRTSYCQGSWQDTLHKFVPTPLTDRNCYVHWGEPLNVSALASEMKAKGQELDSTSLTAIVQEQMKLSLKTVQSFADSKHPTFSTLTPNPWK